MNALLILVILFAAAMVIYYLFFKKQDTSLDNFEEESADRFSETYLKEQITEKFDYILQTDYTSLNLNKYETLKAERNRDRLRAALKVCANGNYGAKLFVIDYIKDMLQRELGITLDTITNVIPFDNQGRLTSQDKFEILLYIYKKKYNFDALDRLLIENSLDKPRGEGADIHYEVTVSDINEVYQKHLAVVEKLDFYDKLTLVAQRCYQITFALGAIDEIRDMNIDGINCGTSGIPVSFYSFGEDNPAFDVTDEELPLMSYNGIWIMFHGHLMQLSCIGFGTQRELVRVSKLVYKFDNPGTLDASKGYIVNYMQDGSRVAVARPGMAESWMFFIRKFGTGSKMSLEEMYKFKGVEKLIDLMQWLVYGCRNIAVTGEQATGKTTLLASLIQFIPRSYGIRIEEMAFELQIRSLYLKRNIATFRETETVSAQEGIDFQKKTDGTINVFGEIAQAAVAALAIQQGQVGAAQVMFSHHAKTTEDLIEAFRDNMIEAAGFNNEEIVEKTVARTLNFDIHLRRTVDGLRYPERVTMIVPRTAEKYPATIEAAQKEYYYRQTDRQIFETYNIIELEEDEFVFKNNFTPEVISAIKSFLSSAECVEFDKFVAQIDAEIEGRCL